jgi:hypothetical protein
MASTRGRQASIRMTWTLAGVLVAVSCTSCSPDGAGSISVPGGKGKVKVAGRIGPFRPKGVPTSPSHNASSKR